MTELSELAKAFKTELGELITENNSLKERIMELQKSLEIETKKAYVAGLFDGEGSSFLRTYKRGSPNKKVLVKRPSVTIAMTDRHMIDYIYSELGRGTRYSHQPKAKNAKKIHAIGLNAKEDLKYFWENFGKYIRRLRKLETTVLTA